jgi:hypothetical protein
MNIPAAIVRDKVTAADKAMGLTRSVGKHQTPHQQEAKTY